jgi:hypothetical protein
MLLTLTLTLTLILNLISTLTLTVTLILTLTGNQEATLKARNIGNELLQMGKYVEAAHVLQPLHFMNKTDGDLGYILAICLTSIGR